jgi:hypothetical protein
MENSKLNVNVGDLVLWESWQSESSELAYVPKRPIRRVLGIVTKKTTEHLYINWLKDTIYEMHLQYVESEVEYYRKLFMDYRKLHNL